VKSNNLKPVESAKVIALKHGAESPRVTVAVVLAEGVVEEAPWLEAEIFQPAIWRYARAEARARLLGNYILSVAVEHPEKVGSRLWESANGADNTASKMAETLGLTPLSRAKLAQLVTSTEATTQGTEVLAKRGKSIRERRDAAVSNRYQSLRDEGRPASETFDRLLAWITGGGGDSASVANALAIVAYFFDRCHIFEVSEGTP
jgi:hypothetical protein